MQFAISRAHRKRRHSLAVAYTQALLPDFSIAWTRSQTDASQASAAAFNSGDEEKNAANFVRWSAGFR
jgi:hypothetical protein